MAAALGSAYTEAQHRRKICVRNLPLTLPEPDFYQLFSKCGTIKNYRIMKNLKTGVSLGYGFVEYTTTEDASKAISELNNYQIQSKEIKVSFALSREDFKDNETNLYIWNLPKTYDRKDLENLFGQFGKIVKKQVKYKTGKSAQSHKVGFVTYENKSEADAAIKALNGQVLQGATEKLRVKFTEG